MSFVPDSCEDLTYSFDIDVDHNHYDNPHTDNDDRNHSDDTDNDIHHIMNNLYHNEAGGSQSGQVSGSDSTIPEDSHLKHHSSSSSCHTLDGPVLDDHHTTSSVPEPEIVFHFHTQTVQGNEVGSYEVNGDIISSDDNEVQPQESTIPNTKQGRTSPPCGLYFAPDSDITSDSDSDGANNIVNDNYNIIQNGSDGDESDDFYPSGLGGGDSDEDLNMDADEHEDSVLHAQESQNGSLSDNDSDNIDPLDTHGFDLSVDLDQLYCRPEEPSDPLLKTLLTKEIVWHDKDFEPIHVRAFTGSGQVHLPDNFQTRTASPLEYWQLFVSEQNIQTICDNTNKYFAYKLGLKRILRPNYTDREWYDLTPNECKAYLGMSLIMGIIGPPRYRYIWSSSPYLRNNGLASVMPLSRYAKISEYFHISDRESEIPNGHPTYDKLGKIRWFIHSKFKLVKSPDKNQCIDESIVKFCGRADFKQWNNSKPIRQGLKILMRSDSSTGFAHIAECYLGARHTKSSEYGLYFDVVNRLCNDIRGKNHHVYFNNLYTSVPIVRFLYTKQIYACGTLRSNKKFLPPSVRTNKQSKLNRGVSKTFQDTRCSNLISVLWKDTRDVKMLSTNSVPGLETTIIRRVGGRQVQVQTPDIAKKYGKNYSGVDRMGVLISPHKLGQLGHSSKKCWKHLFFYYLNLTSGNAFIIYKLVSTRPSKKPLDNLNFRLQLGTQLINGFTSQKRVPLTVGQFAIENINGHKLTRLPVKRARICRGHKRYFPTERVKETVYGCADCQVHLCFACFPLAHSGN